MQRSRNIFWGIMMMLGLSLLCLALLPPPSAGPVDSGVVMQAPFVIDNEERVPSTIEKEFECPESGTYWVQVRYSRSLREIDATLPPPGRKFATAVLNTVDVGHDIRIQEVDSDTDITPKQINWQPIETATKRAKFAADRFELKLRAKTRYRLCITIARPNSLWTELGPSCVVEMSHALRNSQAARTIVPHTRNGLEPKK